MLGPVFPLACDAAVADLFALAAVLGPILMANRTDSVHLEKFNYNGRAVRIAVNDSIVAGCSQKEQKSENITDSLHGGPVARVTRVYHDSNDLLISQSAASRAARV